MNDSVILIVLFSLLFSCSLRQDKTRHKVIDVVHYNIFELDSLKIMTNPEQLRAVKEVLSSVKFGVFSVNELQYDLPGVPNKDFKSKGQNMALLMKAIRPNQKWHLSFYPANTGANAKQKADGSYFLSSEKEARKHADPANYGLFPAQYSSGLASHYPILDTKVVRKLQWREFNPVAKISDFKDSRNQSLPNSMELFDKNFVDTIVEIDNKRVHLITLHTVPAYHFGNKKTPNYQRNADQLAFLEWYLDPTVSKRDVKRTERLRKLGIVPLAKGEHFIAMGDWNTDIFGKNPGSKVLRRLFKSMGLKPKKEITHESHGLSLNPFSMQLDYILHSPTLVTLSSKVLRDRPRFIGKPCRKEKFKNIESGMLEVKLKGLKSSPECFGVISQKYAMQKKASDHFALHHRITFKN